MKDRRRREKHLRAGTTDPEKVVEDRRHGERRSCERVAAEILVEVETSGQRTYRRTANISLGGVGFHAPIPFHLGSAVNMTIRPARIEEPIPVRGEVIGVDAAGRGNRIRFVDLSDEACRALEEHLSLYRAPTPVGVPSAPPDPPEKGRVQEAILIYEDDPTNTEIRLRGTKRILGRDATGADILIKHPTVSRRHAEVYLQNGRHVIVDLSSTNGIFFRGMPIHSLVLKDGMVFQIGQVRLQYLVTRSV